MKLKTPICVDLEETLVLNNLLFESALKFCRRNLFHVFLLIMWRMKGKAFLRHKLSAYAPLEASSLLYNPKVVDYLREMKQKNHPLFLTAASPLSYAKSVASHLGIFTDTFSSALTENSSARTKEDLLTAIFKKEDFIDLNKSKDKFLGTETKKSIVSLIPKQLRIYQWAKNVLVFLPMIAAYDFSHLSSSIFAFLSFSFLSSTVYVLNDLYDLEVDRLHPRKKTRPFASGQLPLYYAPLFLLFLIPLSTFLALQISFSFLQILGAYLAINLAYNLSFKRKVILDAFCLSFLFLLRLYAGSVSTEVNLTPWFMSFGFFFFTSLAFVKRFIEFSSQKTIASRGYNIETDREFIGILGVLSGGISVVIFSLYLNTPQIALLYKHPEYLWFLIPILFLWISRVWLKSYRKEMHDDPVVFALTDKASRYLLVVTAIILFFSH